MSAQEVAEQLRNYVLEFRVPELRILLNFAGVLATGSKVNLQNRALNLGNPLSRRVVIDI
jgi:hypothetical protein